MKMGDSGVAVQNLQEALNKMGYPVEVDGHFGPKTDAAVKQYQENNSLYPDGVVGPKTAHSMRFYVSDSAIFKVQKPSFSWEYCKADKFPGRAGYKGMRLRSDVASKYNELREAVLALGGIITTAGGKRSLKGKVTASRSKTSMHYVGRAFDLAIPTGMSNINTDPYLIERSGDRSWTVWCRTENPCVPEVEIDACYMYRKNRRTVLESKKIKVRAFNFTEMANVHGFFGIPGRRSFFAGGSAMGAEWWHFSWRTGLVKGETTFGEELLKVYTRDEVSGLAHWDKVKGAIYGKDFFG